MFFSIRLGWGELINVYEIAIWWIGIIAELIELTGRLIVNYEMGK